MNMSNSIFRAFLACPARALAMHRGRILGTDDAPEWTEPTSRAMACGTLFDRMVLSGYVPGDKPDMAVLSAACASTYGDGVGAVSHLTTVKGAWNSYALVTIAAAQRLLSDPVAAALIADGEKHIAVNTELSPLWTWRGEIDLLTQINGRRTVIDIKHPGSTDDGWLVCGGKNIKAPWYDVWGYWFQLAGYQYYVESQDGTQAAGLTGAGILYATNSDPAAVGYVALADNVERWLTVLFGGVFTSGVGMLDKIAAIVTGAVHAPSCGHCDFCASRSLVQIPDCEPAQPVVGDEYGLTEGVTI
jgi:hypothetical protein